MMTERSAYSTLGTHANKYPCTTTVGESAAARACSSIWRNQSERSAVGAARGIARSAA